MDDKATGASQWPITKDDRPVDNLEDWRVRGGPKQGTQWRGGRSAKEVARAWLHSCPDLPSEVATLLASSPDFTHVESWSATPEVELALDSFEGESRNTDLHVSAKDRKGSFTMAVEAKADEPFGESIAEALAAAVDRGLAAPSNGVARVEQLAAMILGPRRKLPKPADPPLGRLRYQLLTATAGLLNTAAECVHARAVLLVHEFRTFDTTAARLERNARDLDDFVTRLTHGAIQRVDEGQLYGPIHVPGIGPTKRFPSLYLGKASRHVPDPSPGLIVLAQQGAQRFLLGCNRNCSDGFVLDGASVTLANPADELARREWSEIAISPREQMAQVRRAKGFL